LNRSRLFLAAGVALALVAFVAVLAFGSQMGNSPQAQPHTVTVVVAAQDVGLGTALAAPMLATEDRPADQSVGTYGTVDELVGVVARRAIAHGEVVHASDFQTTGTATDITASLGGGKRGIALPLDKSSAVAYLVQPGDWVDVMIALENRDQTNPIVEPNPRYNAPVSGPGGTSTDTTPYIQLNDYLNSTTVKVLVQNVQVLAVVQDQQTAPTNYVQPPTSNTAPAFIAVLAVSPQQAELLRYAQLDGNVSLVLRSPADQGGADVATTGVTLHELVEKWGVLPPVPVVP
jgi:Flp pilus assembly protein CpaB